MEMEMDNSLAMYSTEAQTIEDSEAAEAAESAIIYNLNCINCDKRIFKTPKAADINLYQAVKADQVEHDESCIKCKRLCLEIDEYVKVNGNPIETLTDPTSKIEHMYVVCRLPNSILINECYKFPGESKFTSDFYNVINISNCVVLKELKYPFHSGTFSIFLSRDHIKHIIIKLDQIMKKYTKLAIIEMEIMKRKENERKRRRITGANEIDD
jgi:hypothetical protein